MKPRDTFQFHSHQDYVAACEELAEDLVSFQADSMDFVIITQSPLPAETLQWLDKVTEPKG
jgi:hypothetical protein